MFREICRKKQGLSSEGIIQILNREIKSLTMFALLNLLLNT